MRLAEGRGYRLQAVHGGVPQRIPLLHAKLFEVPQRHMRVQARYTSLFKLELKLKQQLVLFVVVILVIFIKQRPILRDHSTADRAGQLRKQGDARLGRGAPAGVLRAACCGRPCTIGVICPTVLQHHRICCLQDGAAVHRKVRC